MTAITDALTHPVLKGEDEAIFRHPARQARLGYFKIIVCDHSFGVEALCAKCGASAEQVTRWRRHKEAQGRTKAT